MAAYLRDPAVPHGPAQHAERYRTGGASARQMAGFLIASERPRQFGWIGSVCDDFTAGGPIDAPDQLPSGSCDSITWKRADGTKCAYPTHHARA